jgi:tetratricopeptide (TPR) repeat protein
MTPSSPIEQLINHALTLARSGRAGIAEARRLLEEQLRADPESYPALDAEVEVLVMAGDSALALRLLEEYIRYFPANSDASARLAWLHWQGGKREESLAEIRATLARDPGNVKSRRWLAEWALEMKDFRLAAATAEEAGAGESPDKELVLLLGRAAAGLKDEARARPAYERALKIDPQWEAAARHYAGFLLDMNHPADAGAVLEPFLQRGTASPDTVLVAFDAHHRLGRRESAYGLLRQISCTPGLADDKLAHRVVSLLYQSMSLEQADGLLFQLLDSGPLADPVALEFTEHCGIRGNRGHLIRLYKVVSGRPLSFPRTMARFLSTYYKAPLMPGTIGRWISTHGPEIEHEAILWGGVGAWYVQRSRWEEAVRHLSRYEGRPGVKSWMIHLLGQSLESLGRMADANMHYRRALLLAADHSEAGIRSRLAFNLALDGMAGAGQVILVDMSEAGREAGVTEDHVRMVAVEALATARDLTSPADRKELFEEAVGRMKSLAGTDPGGGSARVIQRFRRRVMDLLSGAPV